MLLYAGNNIKIKQVNTVFENEKIKISWKYGFKNDHFSTIEPDIDEPITNGLRYKVTILRYYYNHIYQMYYFCI